MCQPVGPLPWRGSKEVRPLIDLELEIMRRCAALPWDPKTGFLAASVCGS
jgi:hypothetical protein